MTPPRPLAAAAAAAVLLGPGAALADRPPPAVRHAEATEPPRTEGDDVNVTETKEPFLSLRWHPAELITGLVIVGAEIKIIREVSLIAQFGGGRVKTIHPLTGAVQRQSSLVGDLQGRYYIAGTIARGLYSGLVLGLNRTDTDQLISSPLLNTSSGIFVGPNVGANYTFSWGFGIDLGFLLNYRVHKFAPTTPTTDAFQTYKALNFVIGATLALEYTF